MKKKRILVMIGIATIAIIVILAVIFGKRNAAEPTQAGATYVSTDVITVEPLVSTIDTKGTVEAKQSVKVYSDLNAKVQSVYIEEGDAVEAGAPLMKLDTTDIDQQIRDAEVTLQKAKLSYDSAIKRVADQMAVQNANSALALAETNYDNALALYQSGALSTYDFEQAQSTYDEAEYTHAVALDGVNARSTDLSILSLDIESATLSLETLKSNRDKAEVKSPISGTVTKRDVDPFDLVSSGSEVAMIETTDQLEIETYIGEYDINKVVVGQSVSITGYAVGNETYEGIVTFVGSSAEVQTVGQSTERSVLVKIDVLGQTGFKPNFTADVEIEVASSEQALTVPYESVVTRDDGTYIFTIVDGKAHQVPVTLGVEGEIVIEIMGEGLADGDVVILDPPVTLLDGDVVKVLEGSTE